MASNDPCVKKHQDIDDRRCQDAALKLTQRGEAYRLPKSRVRSVKAIVRHVATFRMLDYDGRQPPKFRQPGDRTMVVLSEGRTKEAELLGAYQTFDLS